MKLTQLSIFAVMTAITCQSAFASQRAFQWSPKVEASAEGFVLDKPTAGGLALGNKKPALDLVCNEAVKVLASTIKASKDARYVGTAKGTTKANEVADLQGTTFYKVMDSTAVTKLHCQLVK